MEREPRERPILFSDPMAREILEGRKTQTRRVVTHSDAARGYDASETTDGGWAFLVAGDQGYGATFRCPYGQPGDRLWVRETWGLHRPFDLTDWNRESLQGLSAPLDGWELDYRADWANDYEPNFWRPSIHMPRWASRLALEVVQVRVQRLQEISEEDAKAEGAYEALPGTDQARDAWARWTRLVDPQANAATVRGAFAYLWTSINGERAPWDSNPWVWVVTFRRVHEVTPKVEPARGRPRQQRARGLPPTPPAAVSPSTGPEGTPP